MKTIAITGHRPSKLGGYSHEAQSRVRAFAHYLVGTHLPRLIHVDQYIIGMALGWDMAVAHACVTHHVPFIAAVPCAGQSSVWPGPSQLEWSELCAHAKEVVTLAPAYSPTCMNDRNQYMVDNCESVLALWDGSLGGTANCVRYAQSRSVPVINAWKAFSTF